MKFSCFLPRYLLAIGLLVLTGCTDFTKASGRVNDTFGMPLENVAITLEHSGGLFQTTTTNNLGDFYLDVIEPCLLVCLDNNPVLTFAKQDYETVVTRLSQFGNICVNVWMRVVGDTSQQARFEIC